MVSLCQILCLSDSEATWSKQLGLTLDLSAAGMGIRTARYAMIVDNLVVKYLEVRCMVDITPRVRIFTAFVMLGRAWQGRYGLWCGRCSGETLGQVIDASGRIMDNIFFKIT